ncbi:MAG: ABC transporter permease [Vicinamibacterales bacterium]
MRRTLFLVRKELQELRRNPRLLPLLIVAPIVQLVVLGYAATTDVREVPIVVADADRSARSRELIERFRVSGYFRVVDVVTTTNEIDTYLEENKAWMALAIPTGYGRQVDDGAPVEVQVVADGSDANSTTAALAYAQNLVAGYSQELLAAVRPPGAPVVGPVDARVRVWFNPQLESRFFMVPGVLALLLLVITSVLASMGIVREKEIGTLEQLNVTPLARGELVVGKLLPYAIIGMADVMLVVAVAVYWFEVPLRGSLPLLLALSLVYLLSTLGIGLFVSSISHTQQQAMMTAMFFFLMPMIFLSGFVFPIENMPEVIQPFTYLIPLRYYLVIVRGIFLKGVGMEALWLDALLLLAWGLTVLTLATLLSNKRAA